MFIYIYKQKKTDVEGMEARNLFNFAPWHFNVGNEMGTLLNDSDVIWSPVLHGNSHPYIQTHKLQRSEDLVLYKYICFQWGCLCALKEADSLMGLKKILVEYSYFGLSSQGCGFTSTHVPMWELDYKEGWMMKNLCFWTVVLDKTLESPLDSKEIKPVYSKRNQSWIFNGRTDAEAEVPILWPIDAKSRLSRKDADSGKDWRQEEEGMTEDEMVGWHHRLSGHKFE